MMILVSRVFLWKLIVWSSPRFGRLIPSLLLSLLSVKELFLLRGISTIPFILKYWGVQKNNNTKTRSEFRSDRHFAGGLQWLFCTSTQLQINNLTSPRKSLLMNEASATGSPRIFSIHLVNPFNRSTWLKLMSNAAVLQ